MKTFVLAANENRKFVGTLPRSTRIFDSKGFAESAFRSTGESLWVTKEVDVLKRIFSEANEDFYKHQSELRKKTKICLLSQPSVEIAQILRGIFKQAIIISADCALPIEQLIEVVNHKNHERYIICGQVDHGTQTVTLIRGNLIPIVIPFSTFRKSGSETEPDFRSLSIDDYGQTLKLGEYEASVDALLFEFDPIYRRIRKAEIAKKDNSIGACLRRLRLQKRLKQSDFKDVDPREIGRIERGDVKPRKSTLSKIANGLGVKVEEISSY